MTHNLLAGVEVRRSTDEFTLDNRLLPVIDLFNPMETDAGPPFVFPLQAGDAESTIVAPYVIDQITLTDRFQVLLGARWDDIEFEEEFTRTERSDGELSPLLGFVYQPTSTTSVYANAARSFAPPSPRVVGEQEPEESEQIEVGLRRQAMGGRFRPRSRPIRSTARTSPFRTTTDSPSRRATSAPAASSSR